MKKMKTVFGTLSHTKRIAAALILLGLVLSCIGSTFAAYVSRSYVKGVAASPRQLLSMSSDYLSTVSQSVAEANYPARRVVLEKKSDTDDSPYEISFYIENTSGGVVSTKRIDYLIRIKGLKDSQGQLLDGVTISYDGTVLAGEALESILSDAGYQAGSMPAYRKITHQYRISIPKDEIDSVTELLVIAVPTTESDFGGNMLAARIQPGTVGTVAVFSYRSAFPDQTSENHPYDFAAFNYEVSVTSATEDHVMLLTWDNEKLEIDPQFASGNTGSLELTMNGTDNYYLIKFYRLAGRNETDAWQSTWAAMNGLITFTEKTTG